MCFQDIVAAEKKKAEEKKIADNQNQIAGAPQSTPTTYAPTPYKPLFQQPNAYQQFQFKTPELQQTVQPYYQQMGNQVMTAGKQAMQSGLGQAANVMGSRNVGRGGLGQMAANAQVDAGQRNTLAAMSDLNLQQARDMSTLAQTQAQMDMARQQMQAGEGQFQAQQQRADYQLENQLANLDRQMDFEEWYTGRKIDMAEREQRRADITSQFQIDSALRQEQYAQEIAPIQWLMQLMGMQSGQQQSSTDFGGPGLIGQIGSGLGALGQIGSGIGTIFL